MNLAHGTPIIQHSTFPVSDPSPHHVTHLYASLLTRARVNVECRSSTARRSFNIQHSTFNISRPPSPASLPHSPLRQLAHTRARLRHTPPAAALRAACRGCPAR